MESNTIISTCAVDRANTVQSGCQLRFKASFKDSLYGKLSFFTHFSKFVVFIRVM